MSPASVEYCRVTEPEIAVGEPLPWPVYDSQENLLLREGFVIQSPEQREQLLARGLYRRQKPVRAGAQGQPAGATTEPLRLFEWCLAAQARLRGLFTGLMRGDGWAVEQTLAFAAHLQRLCETVQDSVLAAVQLEQEGPYEVLHPLHAAVLCELMARRIGIDADTRRSLVSGALTHDLGVIDIQAELDSQLGPLSEGQWRAVRAHPQKGHDLLVNAGVTDSTWLEVVRSHHERIDGSGYPRGLAGDAVSVPARIMAIADIYTAMVRPRAYRDAILARDVLRDLFLARGHTIDDRLVQVFIKEVGLLPVGGLVRLDNGEIAVVHSGGDDPVRPRVFALASEGEGAYGRPVDRGRATGAHAIAAMVPHNRFRSVRMGLNRLWPPIVEA